MKKCTCVYFIAFLMLFSQTSVFGQMSKITLSHNGNASFFTNLTPALTAAVNGDTIYLPGGPINASSTIIINKQLTIVGAGHYPDSTMATFQTLLPDVYIVTGADGGSISGVRGNYFNFGTSTSNQNVNNYRIERCYINLLQPGFDANSTSQNILITENIIRNNIYNPFSSVLFEKNIFMKYAYYGFPAIFNNNIFYVPCGYGSFSANNSVFNNNIFIVPDCNYFNFNGATNCIFYNTLFSTIEPGTISISWYSNINMNTLVSESMASTFENATTNDFSYSNNYHLKSTSNGHDAGTDGTDVGIFGTGFPAKDGAVPFNPHISSKNIAPNLSPTGKLGVDITVTAQDR
jgi:hypothetical protein